MAKAKLLVHIHLYYPEQINFMLKKLRNITNCEWDLYITYCNIDEITKNRILKFKSDAHLIKVENRGYDILPFINIIRDVNLDEYDYILKIHTKNKQKKLYLENYHKSGYWWRNQLINALLNNKRRFLQNLSIFKKNPNIGMICSDIFLWSTITKCNWPEDTYLLDDELKRLNFKSNYKYYCAGTMFMARSKIYKFLQNSNIDESRFPQSGKTMTTGTIAHVYERIFTIAVDEYGFKIFTVKNYYEITLLFLKRIFSFIFSIKNIKENNGKIKQLKILGHSFKLYKKKN